MTAPERIWAWPGDGRGWYAASCSDEPIMAFADVPFIRLDLHEAAIAAARAEGMRAVFSHIKEAAAVMRKFGLEDHAAAIEAALGDASDEFPEASK